MWTTIVVACSQKRKNHHGVDSFWNKNVVAHCAHFKDITRVKDLEDGLRVMKMMHLSPEQMLPYDGLAECLLLHESHGTVLSFRRLGDFVWQVGKSITSETYLRSLITILRVRYDTILKAGMQHKAFSSLTTSQKPHLLEGVFLEV